MRVIFEIKIFLVRSTKFFPSVSPTFYYAGQPTQDSIFIIPWFMKYMYYLSAFHRDLFNSYYCYGLHLYIFLKKIFLSTNIRNKCIKRKINPYFFEVMKNDQIVSLKVCHFQYDNRFFFSREIENIRRI